MTPDQIRAALAAGPSLSPAFLEACVAQAAALTPHLLTLVEAAERGEYLLLGDQRLLLYGAMAHAVARQTDLYRPFAALAHRPVHAGNALFEYAIATGLPAVFASICDGDPAPLIDAIADPSADPDVKVSLLLALARLDYDGVLPHGTVPAFFRRFFGERLAPPGDGVWPGWADAVLRAQIADGAALISAATEAGMFEGTGFDPSAWRAEWEQFQAAPEDPERWDRGLLAPVRQVSDMMTQLRGTDEYASAEDDHPDPGRRRDPGAAFALSASEKRWLDGLIASASSEADLGIEAVDGYLAALLAGPNPIAAKDAIQKALGAIAGAGGPDLGTISAPQSRAMHEMLTRHWRANEARLGGRHPYVLLAFLDEVELSNWSSAFLIAVEEAGDAWEPLLENDLHQDLLQPILALQPEDEKDAERPEAADNAQDAAAADPEKIEKELFELEEKAAAAEDAVLSLHQFWQQYRMRSAAPRTGRKVGRNEPCPCGSGRKYKQCCGKDA